MKRKRGMKSLYGYLVLSFLLILLIIIVAPVLKFKIQQINAFQDFFNVAPMQKAMIKEIQKATIYAIIVGVSLMFVVAKIIIIPLKKLKDATKKVAQGDFTVSVDINRRDEIGDLADGFNKMVEELNSIEYLRKDFVSNVSHEFKTPIASIQGFTKLLLDDNIDEKEKKEYLGIILEESERLSNLSSNMAKLSKFEHQTIVEDRKKFYIDEQIRRAIIMLQEKLESKDIKISLKSDEEIEIFENSNLVMEIWINLLNNAIKYTNPGGKIDVDILNEKSTVTVTIQDTGIGIPKEKQDRIYEKFYQVEKSHKTEGCGLGLAIVKRIVELINGKINFTSEENNGTSFKIVLNKNLDLGLNKTKAK